MALMLVASDAEWVVDDLRAAAEGPDLAVLAVTSGAAVWAAVDEHEPDLAVLDLQIGNMGGMAVCIHLRLEADAGRLPDVPVLMLLDRRADVFLARRSGADGWLVKPLDPVRTRRAVRALLAGERYEDATGAPAAVPSSTAVG